MFSKEHPSRVSETDIERKLQKHWNIPELKFIGQLVKTEKGAFFNSVLLNKKPINYPERYGKVSAYCRVADTLVSGTFYQFHCSLAPERIREKNPYALNVDLSKPIIPIPGYELSQSSNEHFIKDIFNIRGLSPDDAARTARQLRLNELELYTQTERFIFELIQNADDMPKSPQGVSIDFMLKTDFFIFLHNGLSFTSENVSAIADAGKSTKKADSQKTGYKGIGFKSVFSDARTVYIHSGGFSFRFDQDYYKQIEFEELYRSHISDLHHDAKRNFLARYKGKEREMVMIENIPWQIKPLWTNYHDYPDEIKNIPAFFREEVGIALKIGNDTIVAKNYNLILKNLFSEPRFLLFLRHVRNINISSDTIGLTVDIRVEGNLKTITSTDKESGDNHLDTYITDRGNYNIEINNEAFRKVDVPIMIFDDGEKLSFKKLDGSDLNNIPEKLAGLSRTTIAFAAKIEEEKIVRLKENEAILFNYLPTNDTRFGLPFLVNADFITTTNRETIIQENLWNIYLFYNIGYQSICWIAETALHSLRNKVKNLQDSILQLIPKIQTDVKEIHEKFNAGLTQAILEVPFIPAAVKPELLKVSDAVLDKTGIFRHHFQTSFKELYPDKELIHYHLLYASDKLCKPEIYGFEVTVFDESDIYRLFQLESFSPKSDKKQNASFIRLLNKGKQAGILKKFRSVLSRDGVLKTPDELFIYIDQHDSKALSFDTSLSFVSDDLEQLADVNTEFETILINELGISKFDPISYIQDILPRYLQINKMISDPDVNLGFWRFIFKYRKSLAANDKVKLANFYIRTADKQFTSLNQCYLSGNYQTTYQIEEVATQIGLTGLLFASFDYVDASREIEDWRSLFYDCGARKSEGWELYRLNVKNLISSNRLTEENCLVITRFIFEVYRNNRSKFDVAENNVLKSLKLLTEKNGLQASAYCFFGSQQISSILPGYELDNLVSQKYSSAYDRTSEQDWKVFLLAAGVTELSEADIVKKKFLKITTGLPITDFNTAAKIWRYIFSYSSIITNDSTCKQKLKDIQLPLLNGTISACQAGTVYFSNGFAPKSDMENLMGGYHTGFVSPVLIEKPADAEHWRNLLAVAGVKEILAFSGTGNLFEVNHMENLIHYDFALRFWPYFQKYFKVDEINTNSKFRTGIVNKNSIPCLDGGLKRPDQVFPNIALYKDQINDESKIAACDFTGDVITFLGINTNLVVLESDNSFLKLLGNQGERYVYQQLKNESMAAGTSIIENEAGFVAGSADQPSLEVVWNNKALITADIRTLLDSGLPYDFSLKKDGTTDYIEVKTTFMSNNHFMMPESEWNCMLSNPKNYYVYRVNNAGSTPNISVRCLALDALLRGDIRPLEFPLTITI